jgi:hypothetical protein
MYMPWVNHVWIVTNGQVSVGSLGKEGRYSLGGEELPLTACVGGSNSGDMMWHVTDHTVVNMLAASSATRTKPVCLFALQVPTWLNFNLPNVTVVPHSSIFKDPAHLPTFSSRAIQANIANIPGKQPKAIDLRQTAGFESLSVQPIH